MTLRQRFLKLIYPLWMYWTKLKGKGTQNIYADKTSKVSFYSLTGTLNNGKKFSFDQLKGKKILLVNTASNCGYTNQYSALEELHQLKKDSLMLIGFPANDFKEQEKGTDEEIAEFCKVNFGVSFLLMQKSSVIKGPEQNPVFKWLSDRAMNGWNDKQPSWNFSKYVVDEEGNLTNYFGPSVDPMSKEVLNSIE